MKAKTNGLSQCFFIFIIFIFHKGKSFWRSSQVGLVVKNTPANAGDMRDAGSIPGSGRSLGGGYSSPLQYSCLKNTMDRGA